MHTRLHTARRSLAIAAVVIAAAVAALAAPAAEAVTNCTYSPSWGTNRADLASQVVTLINQYRVSIGLSQLATSSPLTASSEWKSLHMANYGYFAHDDPAPPVSRSAYQRAIDCGYGGSWWGENIAWGYTTAQSVVNGWLASAGHKANIENPSYSSTGVGVASNGSGQLFWTQSFGNDVAGSGPPPAPTPPPPPPPPAPAPTPTPTPAPAPTPAPTPTPPPAPAPTTPATPPASVATGGSSSPAVPVVSSPVTPPSADVPTPPSASLAVGAKPAHVTRTKMRSRLLASVSFVQLATGRPLLSGSVRCRAEVDGKRLRVLANVFKGQSARCAWRIPGWAKGRQLTGVVAVQVGRAAATRLFMRTVE